MLCTIALIYQANSIKADETSNKHSQLPLSSISKGCYSKSTYLRHSKQHSIYQMISIEYLFSISIYINLPEMKIWHAYNIRTGDIGFKRTLNEGNVAQRKCCASSAKICASFITICRAIIFKSNSWYSMWKWEVEDIV